MPVRRLPDAYKDLDHAKVPQAFIDTANKVVKDGKWPIYLYGPPGRGKSYAMAALYERWKGRFPVWYDTADLLRKIVQCRSSDDGSIYEVRDGLAESVKMYEGSYLSRIKDAGLCCFDDIALREPTPSQYEVLCMILNMRKDKPTIYTSNVNPASLGKVYDDRVSSRVLAGTWIEMAGEDKRLLNVKPIRIVT